MAPKSSLERTMERHRKEAQKAAKEQKRAEQATTKRETAHDIIANTASYVSDFRVMDKESEVLLQEILDQYDGNERNYVNFLSDNLPRHITDSISVGYEKLKQYGMLSAVKEWITGSSGLTLTETGKKYFEKKQEALDRAEEENTEVAANKAVDEQEIGQVPMNGGNKKVFIVHGHDDGAKEKVARFIEHIDYKPIILHEQANSGRTIIEKIEHYTDVAYAIVLYTPCDLGRDKNVQEEKYRARQNVVFEHGYLIGKLGRDKVCALVVGDVEKPGDIDGVVYEPMDDAGAWKMDIAKEMKSAGLEVDASKLL